MKILAIDPGKSKMAGCIYDTQTHEHRFEGAPLDRGTLGTVLELERPDRVVIEVGSSAGWVGDTIRQAGIELQVANPNHEGWRWRRHYNDQRPHGSLGNLAPSEFARTGQEGMTDGRPKFLTKIGTEKR